jgi:hypothetical protein
MQRYFRANNSEARVAWFAVQSNGESPEMNVITKNAVLGAAGMLILQLAVIASAQETARLPASVPGSSASSAGKVTVAGSSQSQDRPGTGGSTDEAITQPIKRVVWEILHSEGNAIRFIGFQNRTVWT